MAALAATPDSAQQALDQQQSTKPALSAGALPAATGGGADKLAAPQAAAKGGAGALSFGSPAKQQQQVRGPHACATAAHFPGLYTQSFAHGCMSTTSSC